jgi:hypothetical protein
MHIHHNLLPLCLLIWTTHCFSSTGIEDMRSNDAVHGLYEIREEARKFVAQENARTPQSEWEAMEPNLKVLVPRCAVPLKAGWHEIWWFDTRAESKLLKRSRRVIAVECTRTVSPAQKWDVHVPVFQRTRP